MSLESADPHDSDVQREKIEPWENWELRAVFNIVGLQMIPVILLSCDAKLISNLLF